MTWSHLYKKPFSLNETPPLSTQNACENCRQLIKLLLQIIKVKNFDPAKIVVEAIVRPVNRDWAFQTERCHTLSNKTSL